jgi:hypothetical protein
VSLLVGAIGIANVTLVSVLERVGEIGLRRSLGAARRHIAGQFLLGAPRSASWAASSAPWGHWSWWPWPPPAPGRRS